jgi:hypothetical protein
MTLLPSNVSREWKPSDLKYLSYQDKLRARKEIEYSAIRGGPLRPWMKRLAEWAATQPGKPTLRQYADMCSQFAGIKIATHMAKMVVHRDDWLEFRDGIVADEVGRARLQLEQRVGEYAQTHYEAMLAAKANVSLDPGTAAKITEPVLDRVWPKKEERDQAPTTIIVNLAPQQAAAQVLEYEVLPCEIVESTNQEAP